MSVRAEFNDGTFVDKWSTDGFPDDGGPFSDEDDEDDEDDDRNDPTYY